MFRIDLMPARQGDCLWIEYGDPWHPNRVLIDGGTPNTYEILKARIESLPETQRRFELVVITHIDLDHIGGIMKLLQEPPAGLQIEDVWFNGLRHLPSPDGTLGVRQAEDVTKELEEGNFPWNAHFGGSRICVNTPGESSKIRLRDAMFLTLLSPYHVQLEKLQPKWAREVEKLKKKEGEKRRSAKPGTLGLLPDVPVLSESTFEPDDAEANGSSIALLVEFDGKSLLLGADAFAPVMEESIKRLLATTGKERLRLNAYKVSHHGSDANTSKALLDLLDCENYLISTDGSIYEHPDASAISRILAHGGETKTLHFNYRTDQTSVWDDDDLRHDYRFETSYPAQGAGASLVLS